MRGTPQVGWRVAYSASFVRGSGGMLKEIGDMRGVIQEVKGQFGKSTLVKVLWEDETETRGALSCNLSRAEKGAPVQDVD